MHHARQHAETRTRERRLRLAHEAARLMAEGGFRDYHQAKLKAAENDQEASFEEHLRQLRALGFGHVVPVFLEARYGGIVAYK